jgi:ABC-2 type transport system ATP-binding protein
MQNVSELETNPETKNKLVLSHLFLWKKANPMSVLEIKNVTKQFGDHTALDNVSLSVPHQSVYGLLGPNGAGKTTLIRIINMILGADSGEILINGTRIKREDVNKIGYLPEERGLYRKMKVGEHLTYLARLKGMDPGSARKELKYWTERLDITGWLDKKVEELSKGMQQKVQFVATVVHKPELLILDEPFTGFDPINAQILKDELERLRDSGSTIILSTHRMESVEEMCTHMALINKAKKILEGKVKDIRLSNKSNIYSVTLEGTPSFASPQSFELISSSITEEENTTQIMIKSGESFSPNDLLKELMNYGEIHSFSEHIPSINEVFISLVKNSSSHEQDLVNNPA